MKYTILGIIAIAFSIFMTFIFDAGMTSMFGTEQVVSDPYGNGDISYTVTYPGESILPIAFFIACLVVSGLAIGSIFKDK